MEDAVKAQVMKVAKAVKKAARQICQEMREDGEVDMRSAIGAIDCIDIDDIIAGGTGRPKPEDED